MTNSLFSVKHVSTDDYCSKVVHNFEKVSMNSAIVENNIYYSKPEHIFEVGSSVAKEKERKKSV